jgi:hypothetical protein
MRIRTALEQAKFIYKNLTAINLIHGKIAFSKDAMDKLGGRKLLTGWVRSKVALALFLSGDITDPSLATEIEITDLMGFARTALSKYPFPTSAKVVIQTTYSTKHRTIDLMKTE